MGWAKPAYNPMIQIADMKRLYPQFEYSINAHNLSSLTFSGKLAPHINMPDYFIRVTYRLGKSPRVKIIKPDLVEDPPHFYKKQNSLCLYRPDEFIWKKEYSIAKIIIPWVSSWIYFYEVWKETDVWYGEEAEHDINIEKIVND